MEHRPPPTTTTTTVKTPPEEPNPITTTKPIVLSFGNGVTLKHHHHHAPPDHGGTYRECLKNHAAAMGGHAVDGCGEFMHPPPSSSLSLLCAACGCHRNFHRRVNASPPENRVSEYLPLHRHIPPPPELSPSSASPPPISSSYYPSAPHMLLALSSNPNNPNANVCSNPSPSSTSTRKRYRTRFTQTQKEKMFEFAERLGWKMQRRDEDLINGFCNSIGVEKGVFKVWMHNNKNTLGRRDSSEVGVNGINLDNTPLDSNNNNNNNYRSRDSHHEVQRNGVAGEVSGNLVGTNGSSSSS